jgi:hypothetical protein
MTRRLLRYRDWLIIPLAVALAYAGVYGLALAMLAWSL